ncbi:hypothetical protein [Kitasatospora sp. NPDC097643]|uniref:hypothetical protein n=1 Tax=Kitasatospora sp. NPDC097643 TaxID=3157230 RepID=UPI0033224FC4
MNRPAPARPAKALPALKLPAFKLPALTRLSAARLGLAASGWLALAATTLPEALMPLRVTVAAAFLLVCPGAAALRLTHPVRPGRHRDTLEAVVLAVAFSIVIDTVVAEVFFFTRSITTLRAVGALALLTTLLALWPVGVRRKRAASRPGPADAPDRAAETMPVAGAGSDGAGDRSPDGRNAP